MTTETLSRVQQATAYLSSLFLPDDIVEIRPIEVWTEGTKKRSRPFSKWRRWIKPYEILSQLDDLNQWSEAPNHANVYFGVCPRPQKGRGGKADIRIVRSVWADVDGKSPHETLRLIEQAGLPRPSIVVSSGHGTHVYWILSEPISVTSPQVRERVEGVMARMRAPIGGDATQDLSRILRMPGTLNVKNERNGEPRTPVELVEINGNRYSLEEIEKLLPERTPGMRIEAKGKAPEDSNEATNTIENRVRERLEAPAEDRSKRDFAVVCELIRDGWNETAIQRLVSPYSKFSERNGTYFNLTYTRALAEVRKSPKLPDEVHDKPLEMIAHFNTDVGNAARFILQHRGKVIFAAGHAYVYDGKRYRLDQKEEVLRLAKATVLGIFDEAKAASDEDRAKIAKHAVASQKRERVSAMIALARPELSVSPDALDADRWAFNCLNGTINLRTGELTPHDPNDLITKLAPVGYSPNAVCPLWEQVLDRTFGGDLELIAFVQRVEGMALTGDVREQILPIFHGKGGNGKNVNLDTISGILGDYACEAPPHLLTVSRHQEHPTEIADLLGKRLVVASETEESSQLKLQLVKRLTGNARLKGRYMRQDYFEFDRTFKLVLVTNNKPVVHEEGEAAWRRLRLVPFNVVIPLQERDPLLLEKLKAEWPGILAWLVRGCLEWQQEGLGEPEIVKIATQRYRAESDTLGRFIEEVCEENTAGWVQSSRLRREYDRWAMEQGICPHAGPAFSDRMKSRGFRPDKKRGARVWIGLEIKD